MYNFLLTHIIGIIEDNWPSFATGYLFKINHSFFFPQLGYPYGYLFIPSFNQPFSNIPLIVLTFLIYDVLAFNLFIILTAILNVFFAYRFFSKFSQSKLVSIGLALVFNMSPYFQYHYRSHHDLIQFWPVFILLTIIFENRILTSKMKKKIAIWLSIVSLFSNYLGFFSFITTNFILVCRSFIEKSSKKELLTNLVFINFLYVVIFGFVFYFFYFKLPILVDSKLGYGFSSKTQSILSLRRPQEDFFYFSSRPWYLLTPPAENPITGSYAKAFISFLQTKSDYWLTANYFPQEHSSMYIGFVNLFLLILGVLYLKKKDPSFMLLIIANITLIFFLALPPYFTISGIKIYTPNMLIYTFFSIFRTTARYGIVNLVFVLILVSFGYRLVRNRIIIYVLILLQLLDFWMPIKVTDVSKPPEVYSFIKDLPEQNILIYPYSKSIEGAYWIREHNKNLLNLHGMKNEYFDSALFTRAMATCEGISELIPYDGALLLYFYKSDRGQASSVFDSVSFLTKVRDLEITTYQDRSYKNFFINYISSYSVGNSAVVYLVNSSENKDAYFCNNKLWII